MNIEIDAKEVLTTALQINQPGEDIDAAILRACKQTYPDAHNEAANAMVHAVQALAQHQGQDKQAAVQAIVDGPAELNVSIEITSNVMESSVGDAQSDALLNQLPPEMQAKVRDALASGKSQVSFECKADAPEPPAKRACRCRSCGHVEAEPFEFCPKCGERRRRGLLGWLFGW